MNTRSRRLPQEFKVGARVQVNDTMPYERRGRVGTIVGLAEDHGNHSGAWVEVLFDGGSGSPAQWHHSYFDLLDDGPGQSPRPSEEPK